MKLTSCARWLAVSVALAASAASTWSQAASTPKTAARPRASASATAPSLSVSLPTPQTLSHGLFSDVQIFRPAGTPQQFVLLLSGNDAPSATEKQLIQRMLAAGAMVAAVPIAPFYRRLELQDGKCTYAGGAFENLSRHVQAFDKLPTYLLPIIVGAGGGASFAYALLAQAPAGTFASAVSAGFCPRLVLKTPLCASGGLRWQSAGDEGFDMQPSTSALSAPWTALQSRTDTACSPAVAQAFVQQVPHAVWVPTPADGSSSFDAAYTAIAKTETSLGAPPAQLSDLPVVELPSDIPGKRFAVLISGDGGWAGIDKGIGTSFAAKGIPVAGIDSLRYFWTARTPEGLAQDLDRVIRYYAARWKRSEVILVGYSQGADVLPFAVNRLPAATRARVQMVALLGLGQKASFEFHVSNWMGPSGDKPIAPEAMKLSAATTICVYGEAEKDSLCPELAPLHVRPMPLSGGHHFGGDYDVLAQKILDAAPH